MAVITYYYSAHSAFAYLGHWHLLALCAAHGATLLHRPMALSPVVEAQGSLPFAARTQAHVDYFFGREIERWAEWRGVDILSHRPTHHDADYTLASLMILALGTDGPMVDAFAGAVLRAHWRDDADLSDKATLATLWAKTKTSLRHPEGSPGTDIDRVLSGEGMPHLHAAYWANTQAALAQGVMGSPTYVLDGDMFYGQDRLEMLAQALTQPFAPHRWQNPSVDQ